MAVQFHACNVNTTRNAFKSFSFTFFSVHLIQNELSASIVKWKIEGVKESDCSVASHWVLILWFVALKIYQHALLPSCFFPEPLKFSVATVIPLQFTRFCNQMN